MGRVAAAWVLLLALAASAFAGGGPAETVVLVNAESEDSRRVAAHYAKKRHIPLPHLVQVRCTTSLEVRMGDFVRDVVEPLRTWLRENDAEERIRFVVLTQGMPIRAKTPTGDVSTTAALALLHTPLCGAHQPGIRSPRLTPAYRGALPLRERVEGPWLHVTALLSTTADEAMDLVDRSVKADGTAPADALFVFQDANGAANTRNASYDAARAKLEAAGFRTEHVAAGATVVNGRRRVMGYMAGGAYSGLTPEGVASNEFLPGALSDHQQSFGAVPANFGADPKAHSQFPVAHLVRAGVTGVHGAVQEPYTVAFPDPDLFQAYAEGATLAETFDAHLPLAYWQSLVLGDPLCAPYAARPVVKVAGLPDGPWSGVEHELRVTAPGAKRIEVFVDGRWIAGANAAELVFRPDTWQFPDGERHVLFQAVGEGPWEPRGWTSLRATFANRELLRVGLPPTRMRGVLRVPLSRAPGRGETPELRVTAGGVALPGRSLVEGSAVVFLPSEPTPWLTPLRARLTGVANEDAWDLRAPATDVAAACPAEVAAGEATKVRVALRHGQRRLEDWEGRVEVRLADPPVRLASLAAQADESGHVEVPLRFTRTGEVTLRISLPDEVLETAAKMTVRPGPAVLATSPQDAVPRAQPFDLEVEVLDAFGNRAEFEGELRVAFPGDAAAVVPPPVALTKADRGRAVFRDVVLFAEARQALVIADAAGRTWSQPGEGVSPRHAAIRAWTFKNAPKPAAEEPARRLRTRNDVVDVPAAHPESAKTSTFETTLEVAAPAKVRLLGAAPTALKVLVGGRVVFEGTPKQTDVSGRREPLGEVALAAGTHRIAVHVAQRDGRARFSLEVDDGKGGDAPGVVVRPDAP